MISKIISVIISATKPYIFWLSLAGLKKTVIYIGSWILFNFITLYLELKNILKNISLNKVPMWHWKAERNRIIKLRFNRLRLILLITSFLLSIVVAVVFIWLLKTVNQPS